MYNQKDHSTCQRRHVGQFEVKNLIPVRQEEPTALLSARHTLGRGTMRKEKLVPEKSLHDRASTHRWPAVLRSRTDHERLDQCTPTLTRLTLSRCAHAQPLLQQRIFWEVLHPQGGSSSASDRTFLFVVCDEKHRNGIINVKPQEVPQRA